MKSFKNKNTLRRKKAFPVFTKILLVSFLVWVLKCSNNCNNGNGSGDSFDFRNKRTLAQKQHEHHHHHHHQHQHQHQAPHQAHHHHHHGEVNHQAPQVHQQVHGQDQAHHHHHHHHHQLQPQQPQGTVANPPSNEPVVKTQVFREARPGGGFKAYEEKYESKHYKLKENVVDGKKDCDEKYEAANYAFSEECPYTVNDYSQENGPNIFALRKRFPLGMNDEDEEGKEALAIKDKLPGGLDEYQNQLYGICNETCTTCGPAAIDYVPADAPNGYAYGGSAHDGSHGNLRGHDNKGSEGYG
ncbi:knob associated histidine-rich protein [Plasmodium falciparum HB3]|nr:knob associated histidine-rich protein [Plasmodium falciparum HB3]